MKKLSIMQDVVITLVLALWVAAGVPRLSLAQPAEPTMTAPNPDAKGQHPSKESRRVQSRTEPKKAGLDAATDVKIQRQFNKLRSELLEGREKTVDWWLTATAIFLTFLSVVAVVAGYLSFRRFREIETEARENIAISKQHAEDARSLVEEIEAKRDEAESLVGMTAETVGKDPRKAREAAESVQENPATSLIDQAIAAAVLLQQEGKIDEAIDKWRSIASIAEGLDKELGAQAWFSIGHLSGEKADHEAVIDANTQALRLNSNYAAAYYNRGLAKHTLGQYQDARADYDKALGLNPNYADAYNNRGLVKHALNQYQDALADYDNVLRLNPNYAEAYNNRGNTKFVLGQHQAARADYNEALRLNPNYVEAYNNRGNAERDLGQHQAARADYNEALRLNPNFAAAYYHRGLANLGLHQMDEARQDLEKALALAQKAGDEALAAKVSSRLRALDEPKDS